MIGTRVATISCFLEEYTMITAPNSETVEIEFIDPCIDPVSVIATQQIDPDPYLYDDSLLIFSLTDYEVEPSVCISEIEYSC